MTSLIRCGWIAHLTALAALGFSSYALLEEWEESRFRERFSTQQSTRLLDGHPLAARETPGGHCASSRCEGRRPRPTSFQVRCRGRHDSTAPRRRPDSRRSFRCRQSDEAALHARGKPLAVPAPIFDKARDYIGSVTMVKAWYCQGGSSRQSAAAAARYCRLDRMSRHGSRRAAASDGWQGLKTAAARNTGPGWVHSSP